MLLICLQTLNVLAFLTRMCTDTVVLPGISSVPGSPRSPFSPLVATNKEEATTI